MIVKKGLYPYEFVDIKKVDLPIDTLTKEHFYSRLTLEGINTQQWNHVQTVINTFEIKTIRDYHDLYLKIDVYGLVDVFEYHRKLSQKMYGLDPAHYLGLPALTWAAGLRFTAVKLENIVDQDMYLMWEKMKRGGISVISHKYAKANNQCLPDYNEKEAKSFLLQLDMNNLYGWSMIQKIPIA